MCVSWAGIEVSQDIHLGKSILITVNQDSSLRSLKNVFSLNIYSPFPILPSLLFDKCDRRKETHDRYKLELPLLILWWYLSLEIFIVLKYFPFFTIFPCTCMPLIPAFYDCFKQLYLDASLGFGLMDLLHMCHQNKQTNKPTNQTNIQRENLLLMFFIGRSTPPCCSAIVILLCYSNIALRMAGPNK